MSRAKSVEVVVLGTGFGGLTFCQAFRHPEARITLVDRTNHHLFQPLLYQVATAGLSAPEIAAPARSVFAHRPDVTVLMADVEGIDLSRREVRLRDGVLSYDYLVMALGGVTSYFGHPEWEQFAPGLKTLDDAMRIRRDVLMAFEEAETTTDESRRSELLTLAVIGGGPTGVEMAGALAELARRVLAKDFRRMNPASTRVVLIEGSPRVLSHLPADLGDSAARQLRDLGVEVLTGRRVLEVRAGEVHLDDGTTIRAANILWAAGVAASPLTRQLGVPLDRAGRVVVEPDLSLPGHPRVFAIGDMALVLDAQARPVPGVCPAAMQMARHVARLVRDELEARHGVPVRRTPFRYWDKGSMATIGRSAAVAKMGALELSGLPAWFAWLFVHLLFLIGYRNKVAVLWQWAYSYLAYKRGARIILGREEG
ncbi:MAG: NAD(P)/FAD-dependent oxidoreductase [Verrucomicrobiales bacterium]|nr:NAD(P)/FAD-dependent oxidoreductase [Verrucomicrobiales bacterium]